MQEEGRNQPKCKISALFFQDLLAAVLLPHHTETPSYIQDTFETYLDYLDDMNLSAAAAAAAASMRPRCPHGVL